MTITITPATFGNDKKKYSDFKKLIEKAQTNLTLASMIVLEERPHLLAPVDRATGEIAMFVFKD